MKRWLRLVATTLSLCLALSGTLAAQKGGRAHGSSGARVSSSSKPVHVKAYTKKDGTEVAAHDRKAPTPASEVRPSLGDLAKTTAAQRESTVHSPAATTNDRGVGAARATESPSLGRVGPVPRAKTSQPNAVLTRATLPRASTGPIYTVIDPVTGRKTLTNAVARPATTPPFPAVSIPPRAPLKSSALSSTVARDERGRIQRSAAARHAFARQTGYPNGRPGYVIDHIKPLACGGLDAPSNMLWQTIEAGKAKDKVERVGCK